MLMLSRRLALALLLAAPLPLRAQTPPAWVPGLHFRARLIAAGPEGGGRLAGIEIALDRGYKTYWRSPGEAGLPPQFDWSASTNAAVIDILWPAPRRHQDAGGVANVYDDRVVLPVRVRPADPKKPVVLHLALDFGICKEICIPARADLSVELPRPVRPSTPGTSTTSRSSASTASPPRPRSARRAPSRSPPSPTRRRGASPPSG